MEQGLNMSDIQVCRARLVYQYAELIDREAFCQKFKDYLEKIGLKLKQRIGIWQIDNINVDMVSFFNDENNKQTLIWINVAVVLISKDDEQKNIEPVVSEAINTYLLSFNLPKKTCSNNRLFKI